MTGVVFACVVLLPAERALEAAVSLDLMDRLAEGGLTED